MKKVVSLDINIKSDMKTLSEIQQSVIKARRQRNSFCISNIQKSGMTTEESNKKSFDLSLKGMENVAKNLKDGTERENKK